MTLGLAVGLFLVPSAAAQDLQAQGLLNLGSKLPGAKPMVNFYLTATGLNPNAPTAEESGQRSIVGPAATPVLSFFTDWGTYNFKQKTSFVSDATLTLWLTATDTAVLTQLDVSIRKGTTSVATGTTRTVLDVEGQGEGNTISSDRATKLEIAIPLKGTEWNKNEQMLLRVTFFGVAAEETDLDVFVLYGSVVHPSRLSVSVHELGILPPAAFAQTVYLADEALAFEEPTSAADQARPSENPGAESLAEAENWSWGTLRTTQALLLTEDSVLTFWVTLQGSAGAIRGLEATVVLGPYNLTKSIGNVLFTYQSASAAPSVTRIVLAFNTSGLLLPKDTLIDIRFSVSSTSDPTTGTIMFLYGSTGRPAGLRLGVLPHLEVPPPVPIIPTPPHMSLHATPYGITLVPGDRATFDFTVTNPNDQALDAHLEVQNLSGGIRAFVEPKPDFTVPGQSSVTGQLQVLVAEGTPSGSTTITLHLWVESNLTDVFSLGVDIVRGPRGAVLPPPPQPHESASQAPTSEGEPHNLLGDSAKQLSGPIAQAPAPGLWPALLLLATLVVWMRRRP